MLRLLLPVVLLSLAACSRSIETAGGAAPSTQRPPWQVLTRSHVDLWLHGYAMLVRDTSTVPVFRRGYRERTQVLRERRGITTALDANRERLQSRLASNPGLVNGQFLPLYFASFDEMRRVIGIFVSAGGNPRSGDPVLSQYFAVLAQSFTTQADREWLRLFTESLEDERRKFHQEYWTSEHAARLGLVRAVDSLWHGGYRQKLQPYLNNTQQQAGEFLLALTLGAEGRTVNFGSRQNAVASTMPELDAREAIYVFAHEIVSSVVASAVSDNTTPNDQRTGVAAQFLTLGTVRAGAMLLQRVAPELVAGYTRYYLSQAGHEVTGDIGARMAAVFPIPDVIRQAIDRQIDVSLGGI